MVFSDPSVVVIVVRVGGLLGVSGLGGILGDRESDEGINERAELDKFLG